MIRFVHQWIVAAITYLLIFGVTTKPANTQIHLDSLSLFRGKTPTSEELRRILSEHKVWLDSYPTLEMRNTPEAQNDPRGANLSRSKLRNIDLTGKNLENANLIYAELDSAKLFYTNLSNATLSWTNFSGAALYKTNLSGALLLDTNFRGAYLGSADLNKACFEPKILPDADGIAYALNISRMVYYSRPQALVKLRTAFREAGYYRQEREVTYAIKHTENHLGWGKNKLGSILNYILFDLTTQWGMTPWRALLILIILIPFFTIPYLIALRRIGQNGIWRKWDDNRLRKDLGTKEPELLHEGWYQALIIGFYFSILSAFHIGWRELNVGNWIQRIQANEYTLSATGWVRTVSGIQSLISVYLLAIWVLTYFGRPFE